MSSCYFYSRVSTDHQDNSLDCQLAKARAYATARGLTLPDTHIFTDSDTSGSIPFSQRPGGQLLLNTIALHRKLSDSQLTNSQTHLIVTKLDRLGRSVLDLETQFQHFRAIGLTVHIIDFGGDSMSTAGLAGELVLRILFAVAEFERGMIRSRSIDVINHKRGQGQLLGHCPYGWNSVTTGEHNRNKKPVCRLIPNLVEQGWLRQIHLWRTGGMSFHAIAEELNRAGVPTKTQRGRWQSGNVSNVLESRYTREFLEAAHHEPQQQAA